MIRCMHPFTRFLLHGMSGFLSRPALVVSVVLLLPGAASSASAFSRLADLLTGSKTNYRLESGQSVRNRAPT
jgi:hypothetical protein